jgi:hypothetical protein
MVLTLHSDYEDGLDTTLSHSDAMCDTNLNID